MSRNKDRTHQRDSLKIVFSVQDSEILFVDFNVRVHSQASDWSVYPTGHDKYYYKEHYDQMHLVCGRIFHSLFLWNDSGVEEVKVKPYRLIIRHSRAVDVDSIINLAKDAIDQQLDVDFGKDETRAALAAS